MINFFLTTLWLIIKKWRDETKETFNKYNRSVVAVTHVFNEWLILFHRLVKFEFLSICSSFLFLVFETRWSASLTRTITLWISGEHVLRADISFLFFLFASIFSRSPTLTNFFSLVLLFIATTFEAIFTSVSLPGLAILTPAFPLTCFVTHNYSLKLTPTSLLPRVYWNFIPFSTVERLLYISLFVCASLFASPAHFGCFILK